MKLLLVILSLLLDIQVTQPIHECPNGYITHEPKYQYCYDYNTLFTQYSYFIVQPNTGNQTKSFVELGSFKTKTYQTIADHKWYFLGEYGKNSNNFEWSCEGDVLLTCNNEVTATFSGYYTPFSKEKCDPTQFALSPSTFPSTSNPSNQYKIKCFCKRKAEQCQLKNIVVESGRVPGTLDFVDTGNYETTGLKVDTTKGSFKKFVVIKISSVGKSYNYIYVYVVVCGSQKHRCALTNPPSCVSEQTKTYTYYPGSYSFKVYDSSWSANQLYSDFKDSRIDCAPLKDNFRQLKKDEAGQVDYQEPYGLDISIYQASINTYKASKEAHVFWLHSNIGNGQYQKIKYTINVCNIDILETNVSGLQTILLAKGTTSTYSISSWFKPSKAPDCPVTRKLYPDADFKSEWTDKKITISGETLTIDTSSIYSQTLWMKSTVTLTEQSKDSTVNFKVDICQTDSLQPLSSEPYKLVIDQSKHTSSFVITTEALKALYKTATGTECQTTTTIVTDGITGSTPFESSAVTLASNPLKLTISTTSSSKQMTFYLRKAAQSTKTDKLFQIEVCGGETIDRAKQNPMIIQLDVNAGKFHVLDSTTTQAWFTLKPSSAPSNCQINFHQLYSDNAMKTLWSDSTIVFDLTQTPTSSKNYPIKINTDKAFTEKTVYYFAKTSLDIKQYYELKITVCTDAGIQTDGKAYTNKLNQKKGEFFTILPAVSSAWFTLPTGGCPIIKYELFKDKAATTTWNDPKLVYDTTQKAVDYQYPIKLSLNEPYVSGPLYMKASTKSGKTEVKEISLIVCGLSIKDTTTPSITYDYNMNTQWQKKNLDLYFSGITTDCPLKSKQILDKDSKVHDGSIIKFNDKNEIEFNTKQGVMESTWSLVVEDNSGTKHTKKFSLVICGAGKPVVDKKYATLQELTYNLEQKEKRLSLQTFIQSPQPKFCSMKSYSLLNSDGKAYTGDDVSVEKNEMVIKTTKETVFSISLQGTSQNDQTGKVDFKFTVCGILKDKDPKATPYFRFSSSMDPEWQAKNLDLYFSGINPNCPRKSTSVLDKDSKKHDGTLIRINKKDQLEFNTKKSILASEWTLSIEDFFGTKVQKKFKLAICGLEKIVIADQYKTMQVFNFTNTQTEKSIPNFNEWMSSSIPTDCPVQSWKLLNEDNSPYSGNEVSIDLKANQIIVTSQKNLHTKLNLQGDTGTSQDKVSMSINVCGYETLKKKQSEDISSIYNIDEGEGKIALIEGDKWFQSDDSQCPSSKTYELFESIDGKTFTQYEGKLFELKSDTLYVKTESEDEKQVYLTASLKNKALSRQKIAIKICKLEDGEADQKSRKCLAPVEIQPQEIKSNNAPYFEFNDNRIEKDDSSKKKPIEIPDLWDKYQNDPSSSDLIKEYELGKAKDKDQEDTDLGVKLVAPLGLDDSFDLIKKDTETPNIFKYVVKINLSKVYSSKINLENDLSISFKIVISDNKNATEVQFPIIIPKRPYKKEQTQQIEPLPEEKSEQEQDPSPEAVGEKLPEQERVQIIETPQEQEIQVNVPIPAIDFSSRLIKPQNKPVSEVKEEIPVTEIVSPMISSIVSTSTGQVTLTFSKMMMFPLNWIQKYQKDSGERDIDESLVDQIKVPLINFWFEQAVSDGDPLQQEIPDSNIKIKTISSTSIVFSIDFNFLDNPEQISLTLATEQDRLIVEIPKALILNDQDGNSIVLKQDQFDAQNGNSYQIIIDLEPQQFIPDDPVEKGILDSAMSASSVVIGSTALGLANTVLAGGSLDDLADSFSDEQISGSSSALKVVQSGNNNGFNKDMAKAASVDYKGIDFLSARNMTWTSQPPEGEGLKRIGITTKNFPKNIGSSVFAGGGAIAAGSVASTVISASSSLLMEGGIQELSQSEQIKILNKRFKAMNKSNFSVINSILAVVYMKLLIASIVNTQNSELLKSSNFGSNGNLSTGDQISIIIGLIGLLGAFVIYIMLVVTLFSHVPWIFNFGKKVKGIENILRRKQNHTWFLYSITQMRTFIWVYIIIYVTDENMACPQLFLSLILNPINVYIGFKLKPLPKISWFDLNWIGILVGLITLLNTYFVIGQTDVNKNLSPEFKILIGWILLSSGQCKFYLNLIKTVGKQYHSNRKMLKNCMYTCCNCLSSKKPDYVQNELHDQDLKNNLKRKNLIDQYRLKYNSKFYKLEKLDFHPSLFNKVAPIEAFRPYPIKKQQEQDYDVFDVRNVKKQQMIDAFTPGSLQHQDSESKSSQRSQSTHGLDDIEEFSDDSASDPSELVHDQIIIKSQLYSSRGIQIMKPTGSLQN